MAGGQSAAHPRAYGEYSCHSDIQNASLGSSPCIRGIPKGVLLVIDKPRLIPVHTGNTGIAAQCNRAESAHPRAYGEYEVPQAKLRG